MSAESLSSEIKDLNLSYLLLAQKLLLEDKETGMFKLGISVDVADVLVTLTATQIIELSKVDQLISRFTLDTAEKLKSIVHKKRDNGLNPIHAALLLANTQA